ncbi:MAG TPA: hypothetical protein VGH33_01455 [Isosphaeraceae bacterium]
MKRFALLVFLGVLAVHFVGRRHAHHPGAWTHRPAPTVVSASFDGPRSSFDLDGPPAPPPAPKKKATRRAESKPAPAPAPAAEPKHQPDWFPRDRDEEETLARADARGVRVLVGPLSATEEKARAGLRRKIYEDVGKWLSGDVAAGWEPSADAIARMTLASYVQPVAESLSDVSKDLDDLYTLYRAGARLDFSKARRAEVLAAYEHDLVRDRLVKGGALLAFVLFTLAVLAGYIRTDESTKGYYTNRLRMLAAAGVGAAGVVVYRMLV